MNFMVWVLDLNKDVKKKKTQSMTQLCKLTLQKLGCSVTPVIFFQWPKAFQWMQYLYRKAGLFTGTNAGMTTIQYF